MKTSIRELKANPSYFIRQARAGHAVWITSHKRIVARLESAGPSEDASPFSHIPGVVWNGKKPEYRPPTVAIKGKPLSDTVLDMR